MTVMLEESNRATALMDVASRMMTAARTAPKARGNDHLVIAAVVGEDIRRISAKMIEMVKEKGASESFLRDAENILAADAVVLIGTKIKSIGLTYCGLCGFKNCEEKNRHPSHPCAFNAHDLGIAVGSAVAEAMDARVDNRIMYSVGMAVRELNLLGEDVPINMGIPLSATGKNPFFDRKWPK
jgi:uncharacterized ferredoxin-like protein